MTSSALRLPLRSVAPVVSCPDRSAEPVTVGIPLPRDTVERVDLLELRSADGRQIPLQASALDRWPDGSIRWALLRFLGESRDGVCEAVLESGALAAADVPPVVSRRSTPRVAIPTGAATCSFEAGGAGALALFSLGTESVLSASLQIDLDGHTRVVGVEAVRVVEDGPVAAIVEFSGRLSAPVALEIEGLAEITKGTEAVRLHITIRNPHRAQHPSGQWGLGDAGSVLLRSFALVLTPREPVDAIRASLEAGMAPAAEALPFALLQESSGGEQWDAPTHRGRDGRVTPRFRGYRMNAGGAMRYGLRAAPLVIAETASAAIAVAVPNFWQNFPAAITVSTDEVRVDFFPADAASPHELQGGEQKTFSVVLAVGARGAMSDEALAWAHDPQLVHPSPEWSCATGAVPFLVPASADPSRTYLELAALGLEPQVGFEAKREQQDEFGWRHFGDLPADHESAFRPPASPFVSHYNNQYDAVAGFALQFLRTGDRRWWRLMDDLARHVRDIDIYHTVEDKSAYSGGLFWHTAHYLDAGLSTHRTYPRGSSVGGGPSAEHNYNLGLMLHSFLSGDAASRRAAVGLGRWVIDMDDGRKTIFRFLARGATGHASFTNGFYGPGRGAGHSVLACLTAHRLTGDRDYLAKATEIIRRTIHPADDIDAADLLDAERRWSYTAFLQAVGVYLHDHVERGVLDDDVAYARASLLHYARWMCSHERPYLAHPDRLEYPTETWVAQDVRKGDVLLWAALVAPIDERPLLLERARTFFAEALDHLAVMPTRHFTRPVVVVLSHAVRHGWLLSRPEADALGGVRWPASDPSSAPRRVFVPQRAVAMQRARAVVGLGVALVAAAIVLWLF